MNTEHFVRLVREFIEVVNGADWSHALSVLESCARILPRIYAAGLELPTVEPTDADVMCDVRRPTFNFGRYDMYWEIFDPYIQEQPVIGSLADDLGDIYLDLARPLKAYDAGQHLDAVWQWKFNIQGHCGDHLVDAMRAIHRLINGRIPAEFEELE